MDDAHSRHHFSPNRPEDKAARLGMQEGRQVGGGGSPTPCIVEVRGRARDHSRTELTKMNGVNQSCSVNKEDLQSYQHQVYVVVYAIIFTLGLPCNLVALWVFRQYMKETKKAVLFMMNLAVADLMQVIISFLCRPLLQDFGLKHYLCSGIQTLRVL